ncbi:MAG: hypothetical protein K5655_07860 [Lachnospiraceae bacterium]|nr:hypothetical protein [Lachnospiraceae bacterium]
MFLNEKTKYLLEKTVGKSITEMTLMTFDEELGYATEKYGNRPAYSKKIDQRITSRGNPLISRKRMCSMEELDKRILELK